MRHQVPTHLLFGRGWIKSMEKNIKASTENKDSKFFKLQFIKIFRTYMGY